MAELKIASSKSTARKSTTGKVTAPTRSALSAPIKEAEMTKALSKAADRLAKGKPISKEKPASKPKAVTALAAAPAAAKADRAKKAEARQSATKNTTPAEDVGPERTLEKPALPSEEERQRWIATAAYHRAEKRGFAPGYELEDWLAAEKEIDALIGRG